MKDGLLLLSGIGPGYTGVGRIVAHLQLQAGAQGRDRIHWATRKSISLAQAWSRRDFVGTLREAALRTMAAARWRIVRRQSLYRSHPRLILLHPQTLGAKWVLDLIIRRSSTDLYVMDASFFCRSSYNHRCHAPCLECVGTDGGPGRRHGCTRWPVNATEVDALVSGLPQLAQLGRLRFLVQNAAQGELIRRHCGEKARVEVIGLWSDEWEAPLVRAASPQNAYDVVFHGADALAKGSRWAIEVAARATALRFLFPFARPHDVPVLANADFRPCSWETGLGAAIASCKIALNPSLWSAPIEGALVKSIRWATATAVVSPAGSYASDLGAGLVWTLPADASGAARSLQDAVAAGWKPDPAVRAAWWDGLCAGRDTLARMRALDYVGA